MIHEALARAELNLAASLARVTVTRLTIKDAYVAKEAIEQELATWESEHSYVNRKIESLVALVGVPGVTTWLARFQPDAYLRQVPDVLFEIDDNGHVALATQNAFLSYQFQQEGGRHDH